MRMLENKVGIVTGAGQGIGRAIAQSYAREGARVVVADFNEETGRETVELIEAAGGVATFVYGDVSREASVRKMVKSAATAYAVAKGGVNIPTMSSAAEYGSKGIRINAVSPGVIRTPGLEQYFVEQPKIAEGLKKAAVMNRLGEPNEIAEAVTFLSSDRASFITGQILSVDGGAAVR